MNSPLFYRFYYFPIRSKSEQIRLLIILSFLSLRKADILKRKIEILD